MSTAFAPPSLVQSFLARAFLGIRSRRRREERARRAASIPIAYFHRVATRGLDHPETIPASDFRRILVELGKRYRFVSLREVDEILARGTNEEPALAITFDDCYGDLHEHAVPVLRERGAPATFFIASGFIDSTRPFLPEDRATHAGEVPNFTAAQLRELAADPLFEIGAHTVNHVDLSRLRDRAAIAAEVGGSKAALEAITGKKVTRFSVPFGCMEQCHPEVIEAAREAGFERVYTAFGGRNLVDPAGKVGFVLHRAWVKFDSIPFIEAALEGYIGRHSFVKGGPWQAPGFHPFSVSCT